MIDDADKLASCEVPLEDSNSSYLGNQAVTWRQRRCTESPVAFLATMGETTCNRGPRSTSVLEWKPRFLYWGRCYYLFQS
jgi:hypothetical protein